MRLLQLSTVDFRNLESVAVSTDAPFVVFHGPNAQGKTNLLEAVYLLATLKSFRARRNRELIRFGQAQAQVRGLVFDGESKREFKVEVQPGRRQGRVDGKPPSALSEYFAGIRAVLFTPEDTVIVRGGPEERRRFIDRAAFTAGAGFLEVAQHFRRLSSQKSALLRAERPDRLQVEVFNEQLAVAGARLAERRARIVAELEPGFVELHGRISGHGEARLRYRGRLKGDDEAARAESFRELLAHNLDDELRRGFALDGPQRDELELSIDGRAARSFGSQGQVRSVVLALKLSELLAARARGDRPIFLLDDLSSELDRMRTGRLVELLSELDLQVLISTTDERVLQGMPGGLGYAVQGGRVLDAAPPPMG